MRREVRSALCDTHPPHAPQKLEEHGLLTPNYAVVNRGSEGEEVEGFEEEEDYVVIRGKKMNKPFVEKPVDGKREES